jgi:2-aminoadipate transaminase
MYKFAKRMSRVDASAVREILKLAKDPDIISFGGGSPANESFPEDTVRELAHELLLESSKDMLQYGLTEGWMPLRKAYIDHIATPKGMELGIGNVITTTGSTQGIHLSMDILVNEDDTVLVESPTFLSTLMVLNKIGCKCVPVEVGEQGILLDDLEAKIKEHSPRMLYCIPTFQNPTGRTIPLENRRKIASLAEEYGIFVVEDDPYGDLRYQGEQVPPIKSFDTAGRVILLNSFSKIIAPGLRVGIAVAHEDIIAKLVVSKQCADTHSAILNQAICAEYLNRGLLPAHLEQIIPIYRERMLVMRDSIKEHFPEGVSYTVPDGGLFYWIKLQGHQDINELLRTAISEYKVAFVPGAPFFTDARDGADTIRLSFSSNTPKQIEDGIKRLGAAMKHSMKYLPA